MDIGLERAQVERELTKLVPALYRGAVAEAIGVIARMIAELRVAACEANGRAANAERQVKLLRQDFDAHRRNRR